MYSNQRGVTRTLYSPIGKQLVQILRSAAFLSFRIVDRVFLKDLGFALLVLFFFPFIILFSFFLLTLVLLDHFLKLHHLIFQLPKIYLLLMHRSLLFLNQFINHSNFLDIYQDTCWTACMNSKCCFCAASIFR